MTCRICYADGRSEARLFVYCKPIAMEFRTTWELQQYQSKYMYKIGVHMGAVKY